MADQLNRPCSEMTAALFQSHGNHILLAKEKEKKWREEGKQDFWLRLKELVNRNLSKIYSTKQS